VAIARAGCRASLDGAQRSRILDSYRALRAWSGVPAEDLRSYLAALVGDPDPIAQACRELDPIDEAGRGLARLLHCEGSGPLPLDDGSSALGSAAAVEQCLRADREASSPLVRLALCGAELRRLDRAALGRELAARSVSPAAQVEVRIEVRRIETALARIEAGIPALDRDPGLRRLLHDVPDGALREAALVLHEGAGDLAAVRAYEARFVRGPNVAGCFAELRPRLIARLRRAGATLEEVRKEMAGPVTYQLARALESCARYDGQAEIAALLARELQDMRFFRGPRTLIYWRLRDALDDPALPDRPFELPALGESAWLSVPMPLGPLESVGEARSPIAIKEVARQADGMLVRFETVVEKGEVRECWNRRGRNATDRERGATCGRWKAVTRSSTEAPVKVAAENAAGLSPGRPMAMLCDYAQTPRLCAPLAVWKDETRATLVSFLGAEL
jgi:hypothetical protein